MNARGSVAVEAAATLGLFITLTASLLVFSLVATQRLWLDHVLYEALICLEEIGQVANCRSVAARQIRRGPGVGQITQFTLARRSGLGRATLHWTWTTGQVLKVEKILKIPQLSKLDLR